MRGTDLVDGNEAERVNRWDFLAVAHYIVAI